MRSDPVRIVFLALGGYVAALLTFAIHEILGHGAVALIVGGQFFDFYVSPLGGSANTLTSDPYDLGVSAGGTVVTLVIGAVVYGLVLRRLRLGRGLLPTVLLWLFACEAVLDSLMYMTLEPLLGVLAGLESGDWLYLSTRLGFSPWLLALGGVTAIVPISSHFMTSAQELVHRLDGASPVSRLKAFWTLLLPGAALLLTYLAAVSPWLDQSPLLALGSILAVPLVGALGMAWPRPGSASRAHAGAFAPNSAKRWCAMLAVAGAMAAIAFGPTMALRRGVALGPANPDQYVNAAQEIRIEIDLASTVAPKALFRSSPRLGHGSPFQKRLTARLAGRGPSVQGATTLSEFVATWNLDGIPVAGITELSAGPGGWQWEASLGPWPDSTMIRLWPLTWHRESWIAAVELTGRDLITSLESRNESPGVVRWRRPASMASVDSFVVRLRRDP